MGPPVLFRQQRPGRDGRPFLLYKFRTMNLARDSTGKLKSDEERLTRIGAMIRKLSLDELPQLWNVVKGEMSLVGPRPLRMEYLPLYNAFQKRRHEVTPGITGWAQIRGRNAIGWEEKFALDVWYVDNRSLGLDLRILFETVWQAVRGTGVSSPGHVTMPFFSGSD
jgi:lipopolysaccharide/colanic/teichoic acid biosynthesis glycosyltransferase